MDAIASGESINVGSVIGENFKLIKRLDFKGFPKFYLAMNIKSNRVYMAKVIERSQFELYSEFKDALIEEVMVLKKCDYYTIPKIYDIIEDDNYTAVIQEYVLGDMLGYTIETSGGVVEQESVLHYTNELIDTLLYMKKQVTNFTHGWIQLSDIIVKPTGSIALVSLGLLGRACRISAAKQDILVEYAPGYEPPEVRTLLCEYDETSILGEVSDIYSIGVIMYHMLTGNSPSQPPYELKPIRSVNPELSCELENVIIRCTKANPKERYKTLEELKIALNPKYGPCAYPTKNIIKMVINTIRAKGALRQICSKGRGK